MASADTQREQEAQNRLPTEEEEEEDQESDDEEEEPRLKYTRLTRNLGGVYRNGDAVSASVVFGERMITGTHNGNIHILTLPSLSTLRVYHAHSASITSVSISPPPPPPLPPNIRAQLPPTHDRHTHVATASIDGLVCIVPLLPANPGSNPTTTPYAKSEIILKNFKRPITAVALSPNFRTDRTFLSGGLAGNLILSVAPPAGGGGWMGLGGSSGKDTILHSGEGAISAIAWSKESPRFVAWANERGIKLMRSHIIPPEIKKEAPEEGTATGAGTGAAAAAAAGLGDVVGIANGLITAGYPGVTSWIPGLGVTGKPVGDVAWKRISAIERPETIPEDMAAVYKPRLEWIDRRNLTQDDMEGLSTHSTADDVSPTAVKGKPSLGIDWGQKEKLVIGWGGTIWVVDVFAGDSNSEEEERGAGWAEIVHILQTDCTISGLTLYTPSLLLLLAHLTSDVSPPGTPPSEPSSAKIGPHARRGRSNALTPELRFIDLNTSEELSADELMMNRFEGLSAGDYHLGVLPATPAPLLAAPTDENNDFSGAIALAGGLWNAGVNATQILSSATSVRSFSTSVSRRESFSASSFIGMGIGRGPPVAGRVVKVEDNGWGEEFPGKKIYITSPYDVVFATERSLRDHLGWLLEKEKYQDAWELVDRNPDVIASDSSAISESGEDEVVRRVVSEDDPSYDSDSTVSGGRGQRRTTNYSATEKEKRRIGELWLQKLINAGEWTASAEVCGKVLGLSGRWEHWVWVFEAAGKITEITPYIPTTPLSPPLPSVIYEIVLAHYLSHDVARFRELLLENWKPEGTRTLYDPRTIIDAVTRKLKNHEDSVHSGDAEWRALQECLAKLYMTILEPASALRHYMILKDADAAFSLIREYRLIDAIKTNIYDLLLLRVSPEKLSTTPISTLEENTSEAISLLVAEANRGIVGPSTVVSQLSPDSVRAGKLFLFFYLRRLWSGSDSAAGTLVEFGDLMVTLFAEYDRPLLMDFLVNSHTYSLEKASAVCEKRAYIPELVHLLSKTGQTKRALFLIIDKLHDVGQAIAFAKNQDDPDLWNDLLEYSMDKPRFIRGLLENVGTAIDPITLVRRIPAGLQIEGLKPALGKILKEYGVQWSVCEGVAKVLRSEVARGMEELRGGQRRAVRFEVKRDVEIEEGGGEERPQKRRVDACGDCGDVFLPTEKETLIGFACGHVFHLGCLLGHGHERERERPAAVSDDVDEAEEEIMASLGMASRNVGSKVTHAALIRQKVSKGCVLCAHEKGDDDCF